MRTVVGCTLPKFDPGIIRTFGLGGRVEAGRLRLNDAIREGAPAYVDLARLADADPATFARPDGIHFTRAGYRALGLRVAETLEEALIGRKAPPRTAIYPGLKKPPPAR